MGGGSFDLVFVGVMLDSASHTQLTGREHSEDDVETTEMSWQTTVVVALCGCAGRRILIPEENATPALPRIDDSSGKAK